MNNTLLGAIGNTPLVDEILIVTTQEAKEMTRRLAREEGIFAGTSTGANVVAGRNNRPAPGPWRDGGHHHC